MVTPEGGVALLAHSVGSSDASLTKRLSQMFNRKVGHLHTCVGRPCTEAEEGYLHVTRLRVYTREGFNPPYFMPPHCRQVKKWLGELEETLHAHEEGREADGTGEEPGPEVRSGGEEVGREVSEKKGKDALPKRGVRPSALRASSAAQRRARGKGVAVGESFQLGEKRAKAPGAGQVSESVDELPKDLGLGSAEDREEMSTSELRQKLDAVRLRLGGSARPSIGELRKMSEEEDSEGRLQEAAADSGFVEELRGLTSGANLRRKRSLEDTKDSSMKDISSQLVRQAQQRSAERSHRRGESRERRGSGDEEKKSERAQLLRLLNQAARGSGGSGDGRDPSDHRGERSKSRKKKKKKKGKNKKRGKKRKLVNGVIISSDGSDSSYEDSDDSGETSSTEGFEAPLRRRSKAHPGAVLRLLVQQAQEALDQSALVETGKEAAKSVTEGVKITTYFNLHVKPLYSHHRAAMRDLSLMSQVLDTIRAGSIARAADLLAAHFIAAHQALVDNSWSQAKYLEVATQDDPAATSAAILLEARKHAKASLKVETPDAWVPHKGWGKSWQGGGKWQAEKGKGKTKKGGKQKDKGSWGDREGKGKGQGREGREVRSAREATLRPLEEQKGLAPVFQEDEELREEALKVADTFEESGQDLKEDEALLHEELSTGQAICLAVGRRVRDIRNGGTLLAWMLAQSMTMKHLGPWRWVYKVVFDSDNGAAGYEKPKRAVSFPMRRGLVEETFQRLLKCNLDQAASEDFSRDWAEDCWLFLALHATSGLAGRIRPLKAGQWSALERRGATAAKRAVQRTLQCSCGPLQPFEKVAKDLRAARIDYNGEETGVCERLCLEQIEPALPPLGHGGRFDLEGTKRVLEAPEKLLKSEFDQPRPRIPGSVHFGLGEELKVSEELVRRGICQWIRSEEVVEVQGTRILNGLFGVKKPSCLPDGRSILRVIMNLKATNSVMHQVRGAVEGLPAITAWQAAVLELDEQFRFFQSDISSAFYLFELPSSWLPYLAFAVSHTGEELGLIPGETYQLACRVITPDGNALVGIPYAGGLGGDTMESRACPVCSGAEGTTCAPGACGDS